MSNGRDAGWFFGATAWSFSWDPPYEQALRRIARLGLRGCELIAWSDDILRDYYTPDRIAAFRRLMDGEGLRLTNFFFSLPFRFTPGAATSRADLESFRRGLDTAVALGAKLLTSTSPYPFARAVAPLMRRPTAQEWTIGVEPQQDWQAEYEGVVVAFREAASLADDAGLRLAIEPHPFRWVSCAQALMRLVERTGAPALGLNFDPSHLFPGGDMPHYAVHVAGNRVFHTHLSDNDGATNAHWRPGRGKVDWVATLGALAAIGYAGPLSLELEDAPGASHRGGLTEADPVFDEEMRRAAEFLRAAAASIGRDIA
jgi:sugar phosphate isomerase/epimerase